MIARAADERVPQRLWDRDDTLWGPAGQPEVADRLAWLDAPATTRALTDELLALTDVIAAEGYTDVLLVGMGGSSLAPAVICSADPQAPRRLRMLDSTDPDAIASVDAATDPDRTLVLVSTKSGGTIETISLFRHFWSRRPEGAAFVAVTDPGSGLEALAQRHGFRAVFRADPEIGGRYSALSPFGIVPAALIGLDHEALLDGGQAGLEAARADVPDNAAVRLGAAIAALARAGRDKLVVRVQDPDLGNFSLWLEQLVAESTGKHGVGVLPVVDDPGADITFRADLTGPDRQLLVIRGSAPDPELDEELATAAKAGVPVLELVLDHDPERASPLGQLGWAFATTEVAVAVAGWALAINPFDQPDVQAAKDATQTVLSSLAAGEPLQDPADATADAIAAFASGLRAPGYLSLLAYVPPSPTGAAAIERLRAVLATSTDAAITAAFGPRYLHSTGQLHKGGAAGGRFLILEHEPRATRAIPADPEQSHPTDSFAALLRAQAQGDERTLEAHDRAVLRLSLGTDWLGRLDEIVDDLEGRSS
ncbi:MAG: glucose-6-phosphate isomerase [Patulibacter sp.]|nr:glucose-6-phosphate isomerase [Patulibacter sp.]